MDDQMETARRGQPAGGGVIGNLSVPKDTPKTPNFQIIDAALAEIDAARRAARTAGTGKRREHFQRVAGDLANWLADDVLKARRRIPNEPRGQRVPPTAGDLRILVEQQRRIATARAEAELWDAATWAALTSGQSNWERLVMELSRAESRVAELEREARPYV